MESFLVIRQNWNPVAVRAGRDPRDHLVHTLHFIDGET